MPDQALILKAIQHPLRQEILYFLNDNPSLVSYTELLPYCEDSTGKLNYHLRILAPLIEKQNQGYGLSPRGQQIIQWMGQMFNVEDLFQSEEPDVVFQKILPSSQLYTKYLLQVSIGFLPFFFLFFYLAFESAAARILVLGEILLYIIIIILMRKYINSFWYRITDTEIIVHKGIITRSHKIVPYRTITNVDQKQGPFDRFFKMHTIDIHTAGNPMTNTGAAEQLVGMIDPEEVRETLLERIRLLNPPAFINTDIKTTKQVSPVLKDIYNEFTALNRELKDQDGD